MKHCVKKLLSLAFALALCLAVGGTALAETPVFAAVLAALPEQEMLAFEPNVTTAEDTTTIGDIATDGYQVTIPTTVTVNSGTNTEKLKVTAQLKQYRTLNITMKPQDDKWTLKYQGAAAGTATPGVDYQLPTEPYMEPLADNNGYWLYQPDEKTDNKLLSFSTTTMTPSTSPEEDMKRVVNSSYELPITVPHPEQATMSGTYSDTLAFEFAVKKLCVTYTINMYGQKLVTKTDGWHNNGNEKYRAVDAVNVVDASGNVEAGVTPDYTVTLEYKSTEGTTQTWTRTRPDGAAGEEDARCWEDLDPVEMTPRTDFEQNKITEKTINLNLKRKWYWLDVNGITDQSRCADCLKDGNQGGKIASFVNIRVSVDDGTTWSDWFWYSSGDDYWGTFPYGTKFQLGLHRVKDGYAYDADDTGNVAIYANGELKYTQDTAESPDGKTHYRVYQGKLEGEPVDTTLHDTKWGGNYHEAGSYPRYCYNVCFVDGITYYANGGTGGREDTNLHHGAHTSFKYTDDMTLADPITDCDFTAPKGKSFAGWSTTPEYTAGQPLYDANVDVSHVEWPVRPSTSHNDTLPDKDGQTVCRTLYAIWGYDITVQFEDETGYSTNDGRGPVATLGGTMDDTYSFTLKGQAVDEDKGWTLDLTDPKVTAAIDKATKQAKFDAEDDDTKTGRNLERKIWKIDQYTEDGHGYDFTADCTLSAEDVKSGKPLVIQRRRYLLSVISADTDTDRVNAISTKANNNEFGTFNVTINDGNTDCGVTGKSHCQVGLNYGAKYTVNNMKGISPYIAMQVVLLKSLTPGDSFAKWLSDTTIMNFNADPYTSYMTGKQTNIHYYTSEGALAGDGYTGDPVRVAFNDNSKSTSTTPMPGPSLAPAKKALTLRYHANFDPTEELALDLDPDPLLEDMDDPFGFDPDPLPEDVDDALEEAVKTVRYQPGEDVVLRNCMFKRGGYVFVGWNTEPDGTGRLYRVNGVPITDWADGDTVDLYAQWKKPEHLKPVVDNEPFVPTDPDTPPERVDDGFDADFGADPDPLPEGMDDAFGV